MLLLLLLTDVRSRCATADKIVYVGAYVVFAVLHMGCLVVHIVAARTTGAPLTAAHPPDDAQASNGNESSARVSGQIRDSLSPVANSPAAAMPAEDGVVSPTAAAQSADASAVDSPSIEALEAACEHPVGYKLRLRFSAAIFALRSVFSVVFVGSYLGEQSGCNIDAFTANGGGSSLLLLLVLVMLVDGQGATTAFLFGFDPCLLAALAGYWTRFRQSCARRWLVCRACLPDRARTELGSAEFVPIEDGDGHQCVGRGSVRTSVSSRGYRDTL